MRDLIFFFRVSWSYLGCDQGHGRWKARWKYFRKSPRTYFTYRQLRKRDHKVQGYQR